MPHPVNNGSMVTACIRWNKSRKIEQKWIADIDFCVDNADYKIRRKMRYIKLFFCHYSLQMTFYKGPNVKITDKCFGTSREERPMANPAKLCASGLCFQGQQVIQPASGPTNQPTSQSAGPECPWCHLRIMGKECSQLFSVLIISNVKEMEGLWVHANPAAP